MRSAFLTTVGHKIVRSAPARAQSVSSGSLTAMPRAPQGGLRKITAGQLKTSKPTWWLESRFHFSFADYYNPDNVAFGALRVLNDDLVKGRAGFGTHPHRNAEIFSYIVDGELTHKDSMGNKESLPRGSVQYLSAGTGITHSEMNDGADTTRFLQIWLTPDRNGVKPQYGSAQFGKEDRHNKLLHLLGGTGEVPKWESINQRSPITLHQDANVFVSESDAGVVHSFTLGAKRQAYLVCIEGSLDVNGTPLAMRDALELVAENGKGLPVTLTSGDKGSHIMLIELQKGA